jgi:hypothetical protein
MAVATNNPEGFNLGKGEIDKVNKVLAFLIQNLKER